MRAKRFLNNVGYFFNGCSIGLLITHLVIGKNTLIIALVCMIVSFLGHIFGEK